MTNAPEYVTERMQVLILPAPLTVWFYGWDSEKGPWQEQALAIAMMVATRDFQWLARRELQPRQTVRGEAFTEYLEIQESRRRSSPADISEDVAPALATWFYCPRGHGSDDWVLDTELVFRQEDVEAAQREAERVLRRKLAAVEQRAHA